MSGMKNLIQWVFQVNQNVRLSPIHQPQFISVWLWQLLLEYYSTIHTF